MSTNPQSQVPKASGKPFHKNEAYYNSIVNTNFMLMAVVLKWACAGVMVSCHNTLGHLVYHRFDLIHFPHAL